MERLPKHIIKSLINNETSLGNHPAFPPDDEEHFIVWVLTKYYKEISDNINTNDDKKIEDELSGALSACKKTEMQNKEAIEELCNNIITDLFEIPEDTIDIKLSLVNNVDVSNQRLIPEKTDDYTFDSIEDMNYLTDEIYKRRMLNCLITGAAMYYSNNIEYYVKDLFRINPELPSMYSKILKLNNVLLYLKKDTLNINNAKDGGKVDVYIASSQEKVKIEAEAVIMPILIEEAIKGLLELAISHGLPKDKNKAEYIIKKSDFKLAELWDMRIGCALWNLIMKLFDKNNIDIEDVGINFFFMKLSMLEPKDFNKSLQEIFRGTNNGNDILNDICDDIIDNKERDDFNDFIKSKQDDKYTLTDDYYTSDELSADNYYTSDELISDSIEF